MKKLFLILLLLAFTSVEAQSKFGTKARWYSSDATTIKPLDLTWGLEVGGTFTLGNQSSIVSGITTDYSTIYPYDNGSDVSLRAVFDDNATETDVGVLTDNNWASPSGGAILNGTSQCYSHPDNDNLDFGTGDFTLSVWFKHDGSTFETIIAKGKATTATEWQLGVWDDVSKVIFGAYSDVTFSAPILTGQWNHCIVVRNGVVGYIYINGSLAITDLTFFSTTLSNSKNFNVGARDNGASHHFSGSIGQVILYNYALTQSEVTDRWNQGKPWNFVEPYATSGASNTTLVNSEVLTIGKTYKILNLGTPTTDFTSYGSADNNYGTEFVLSGALTLSTNDSLVTSGNTFQINNDNWGTNGAKCIIGGELSVANSIASPICPNPNIDGRQGVSTSEVVLTNTQKKNTALKGVWVIEKSGSANTYFIGTATGSYDIANGTAITADKAVYVNINELALTERSLYVKAGASSLIFILDYEEL